jgi:hypothetical protein
MHAGFDEVAGSTGEGDRSGPPARLVEVGGGAVVGLVETIRRHLP